MTQDIINAYAPIGIEVLKQSLAPNSVSGKTVNSIRAEVSTNRLKYLGSPSVPASETGRAPRKSTEYGHFDKGLEEYLHDRGFPSKKSSGGIMYFKIGPYWYSGKSLAYKINSEGSKLWRQGHGTKVHDVYSNALAKFVEELSEAIKKDKMDDVRKQIKESLNGINSH